MNEAWEAKEKLVACIKAASPDTKRAYLTAIQPYVALRAQIIQAQPSKYPRNGVNGYDLDIRWLPGAKEDFDMAGECIDTIRKEYFKC